MEVADLAAKRVGGKEAAETWGVVTGEGIIEPSFGIAFVAGIFVIGRAGGGLQPLGM